MADKNKNSIIPDKNKNSIIGSKDLGRVAHFDEEGQVVGGDPGWSPLQFGHPCNFHPFSFGLISGLATHDIHNTCMPTVS